jgi:ATP-dependent Clp protease adaptor protein ClpS
MSEKQEQAGQGDSGQTAVQTKPARKRRRKPRQKPPAPLPPWKVLLHNDDVNSFQYVLATIVELTPLKPEDAFRRMMEAHETGVSLLLTTHKERAELYRDQFQSKGLTVTIEPAE